MKIVVNMTHANERGKKLVDPAGYFKEVFKRTGSYIKASNTMRQKFDIQVSLETNDNN